MTLEEALRSFCVRKSNTAALAIATDGVRNSSKVGMIAVKPLDPELPTISVFVAGADMAATEQYHGIPYAVYDSMSVEPETVEDHLEMILAQHGIEFLVSHSAFRFTREKLLAQRLLPNGKSFIDPALMVKAVRYWNERLRESASMMDMQARIERLRGANVVKLEKLMEDFAIKIPEPDSPYIPLHKAEMTRLLFLKLLEEELPY